MRHGLLLCLGSMALVFKVAAQTAVDVARPEERQKAQQAVVKEQEKRAKQAGIIEFRGEQAFKEKELRTALKEEITTVEDFGLSPARADDLAFFLEVFYRKHGYADVNVHYTMESQNRVRLDIAEGPRYTLGTIVFDGNAREPSDKLFEYAVGPTRERYSRTEKRLPFVAADMQEGATLVHRFYLAQGFLDAVRLIAKGPRQTSSSRFTKDVNISSATSRLTGAPFTGPKRCAGRCLIYCSSLTQMHGSKTSRGVSRRITRHVVITT